MHCQDPAWDNTRTDQVKTGETFVDVISLASATESEFNREAGRFPPPAYEEGSFKESDLAASYVYDATKSEDRYGSNVELQVDSLEAPSSSARGDVDAAHRQSMANYTIGFGRNAIGGKNGRLYVVASSRDDDPANPSRGTLQYAVTRAWPLWIISPGA